VQSLTKISIIFYLLLGLSIISYAQKKIKIENSEFLEGGRNAQGEKYDKFIGNVIFSQGNARIYCDTAVVLKKKNYVQAFGNVRITDGDSVVITSRKLIYNTVTRIAKLRENVVFTKIGIMTLYTNFLDYSRQNRIATFFNHGKLIDSTNQLTSKKGYYEVDTDMASFKDDVIGENEDYTLKSDTLQYNTVTKIMFFRASTELTDKEGNVYYYEEGTYNTNTKKSVLVENLVETEEYILKAQTFRLDDIKKYYVAKNNVELIDKESDYIVTGQSGEHWKDQGITKIYDEALLKVFSDQDTLFLTADTLIVIDNKLDSKKRLLAFNNVKFFRSDLQGKADSLAYHVSDSIIFFYGDPILWNEENQISADSINAIIINNKIERLNMSHNSFVISQDTLLNFNQIKGREMTAFFKNSEITKVDFFGNGESIFFALDDDETYIVGMNKSLSSTLTIRFKEKKAERVIFYDQPEASFIPPHELKDPDKALKGFRWRIKERPLKETVVPLKINLKEPKKKNKSSFNFK